ncbi:transposase [Brevibacterium sp. RIT803]|nr:transposase [Brevibacterium sp. RIT 803]
MEARRDPAMRNGAIARIAEQTGVHKEALQTWVKRAEDDDLPTTPIDSTARIRQLEAENRGLKKTNEILRSATAYFGKAEFDRLRK